MDFSMACQEDFATTITATINSKAPKTNVGLRPLGDRVLVKVIEATEELINGLVRPDIAKEQPLEGTVIAVGNGLVRNGERIPVDVKVGQRILFGKYCGNDVSIKNEKLLLLQEPEIQAVFED